MKYDEKLVIRLSFLLFVTGFTGIFFSAIFSTQPLAEGLFIASSLALGASLLAFLFIEMERNRRAELVFLILLLLVSIIKVIGIHLKYGIYMGADAFVEYNRVIWILENQHMTVGDDLAKTPLSMIYASIAAMFTGIEPLAGSFNLLHLITGALIPLGAYILIRNSFDIRVAIIGAFILAYHPTSTVLGLSMTRENVALVFFMLAVILIIKQLQAPRVTYLLLFSVLSLSLILSHYTTAYFSVFITGVATLALFSFHIREFVAEPKSLLRLSTPLIFFAFFIPFQKFGLYPALGTAEDLTNTAIRFLLQGEIILPVFLLVSGYLIFRKPLTELIKKRRREFLWGSCIGLIIALVAWLKMAPLSNSQLHYQSIAILIGTSFVDILYKIYAFFFIAGCAFCLWKISERNLNKEQSVLAVVGIFSILMAVVWVVSELSISLEPHRALRFSAMIGSLVAALLIVHLYDRIKTKRTGLTYIVFILIVFGFPITAYVSDYLAFSKDTYPSKLHDNMYNIRAMEEIKTFDFMKKLIPEKSHILVEFNRGEDMLSPSSHNRTLMNKMAFLTPKEGGYLFLRKSLFKYGQYIQYPEGSYFLTPPRVVELKEEEFKNLTTTIEQNDVVYSQDGYKLVHIVSSIQ